MAREGEVVREGGGGDFAALVNGAIERYPELRAMDRQHAAIVLCVAAGMSIATVAKRFGISRSAVQYVVDQYKLSADLQDSIDLQKLVLVTNLGTLAVDIVGQIHTKRDQLSQLPVTKLIDLLSRVLAVMGGIEVKAEKRRDMRALSEELEKRVMKVVEGGEEGKQG